jgi:hypothetical protein
MEEKEAEQVEAQFVDPASASLGVWLIKVVIGGIIWSVAGFFAKLGLNKLFKKKD